MKAFVAVVLSFLIVSPAVAEIEITEVTSPGGITAWLVPEPSIPFVSLEIRFKGGASLDLPDRRGATNLMVGLLEEGAGEMDAQQFAQASEELAARFKYSVYDDAVSVSAQFLSENQDSALALLRETLVAPRFDADAIERVRAQVLSGLRSDATDPDSIVGAAFDQVMFPNHPYGSRYEGTLESVSALTRDDIVAAWQGALARDRIYVSAAGDITPEAMAGLLDRLLGDLPATGRPQPPDIPVQASAGVTVIPFDTPQSVALFGHEGIGMDDPDFFPAYLMNVVLGGGGFEARLMTEVREKRGLTYGVYTYLATKDHAALVAGRVASANNRVAEAIQVITDEWAKMASDGVTQDELDQAKTYLTGSYPLRFDGNGPIAAILAGMQMDDFPIDYARTRNARIEAVTLEDVKRVAARLLKPEALRFVVVGQPEGLPDAAQVLPVPGQ
ncbi:M16 family metallopeptidase [Puniceibacterium confluentis]|uniref:M16 family metallopeptidase n=1 Tax=Puniceibacterium confluentis TaxID=1958944 RepID=UPI0035653D63